MKHSKQLVFFLLNFFCIGALSILLAQSSIEDKLRHDESLVAPGIGSNLVLIGESIDSVMQQLGRERLRISKPAKAGELFKDVFHAGNKLQILFSAIYYNENNYALCVNRGTIVSIIGFNNAVVTIDGVSLKTGINNFIFHYGNNNCVRIKSGTHGLYVYPKIGFAIIDDDMNDTIDLYIVFTPQHGK
jgi:hypothetical protein